MTDCRRTRYAAGGFVGRRYVLGPMRLTEAEARADAEDPALFPGGGLGVRVWETWQEDGGYKERLIAVILERRGR